MPDENPVDRRKFFRTGMWDLLRPLAKPIERRIAPLERALGEFNLLDEPASPKPSAKPKPTYQSLLPVLRPPGAMIEEKFLETCTRCGHCVSVCPAAAIQIDETQYKGKGYPFVDAEVMPCVVCEGLHCMRECPSEALGYVPRWLIDMGTAVWNDTTCVRNYDDSCTTCIDQCPIGSDAIELRDGKVHVKEHGCVGCGVCQYYCPTYPKSITVTPKAGKNAEGAAP